MNGRNQRTCRRNRLTGLESLESRQVMDCFGVASVELCVPGDSNGDYAFDESDLIQVFQAAKYDSESTADWGEGDWNRDRKFDSADLVTVFQAGTYLQGNLAEDLSAMLKDIPAPQGAFSPPIVIEDVEQLHAVLGDRQAAREIARSVDIGSQSLLFFSWSGSGADHLVAEPIVLGDQVHVKLRFRYGLTDDLRPHWGLLAIPKAAVWNIDVQERHVHADSSTYEFDAAAKLVVTGGFAGVRDEYSIEGSFTLTRREDGSAMFSQVDAVLRGVGGVGLSSLDGKSLDSVLNLSELAGLQVYNANVVFSGLSHDVVVRLFATVGDRSLTLDGQDFPPCCDFFGHAITASASVQGNPR